MFDFSASSPDCSVSIELYGSSDIFSEFGTKLLDFPQSINDVIELEQGKDRITADYLYLKAYISKSSGHSAINVVVNSAVGIPGPYRAEFGIVAEPAEINRLGQMLSGWDFQERPEMAWKVPSD